MEKSKTILNFLKRIKLAIDFNDVEVVDYWDLDLYSIGLKKKNKLVYIAINKFSKEPKRYNCDLELVDERHIDNVNVIKEVRCVSAKEIIAEIKYFFEEKP